MYESAHLLNTGTSTSMSTKNISNIKFMKL